MEIHEIQLVDEVPMTRAAHFPLYRDNAFLHSRLAYTHSDCSSSLSSISLIGRQQQRQFGQMYTAFWQRVSLRRRPLPQNKLIVNAAHWISAFVIIGLSAGLCCIHGIFQQSYGFEFADYDNGAIKLQYPFAMTLIGALQFTCFIAFQQMPVLAHSKISNYAAMLLGAITTASGLLAAGFANTFWQLCLSQGMLVGIGAAVSAASVADSLKSRGLLQSATPMIAASGVGGSVLTLVVCHLIVQNEGTGLALRWLALIAAGGQLIAVTVISTILYREQRASRSITYRNSRLCKNTDSAPWQISATTTETTISNSHQPKHTFHAWQLFQTPHFALSLVSSFCHHLYAPAPFLFIPSYVAQQLSSSQAMASAALLVAMCFSLAIGNVILARAFYKLNLTYSTTLGLLHIGLSLTVWCLWLPAADSWVMVSLFSVAYGLLSGVAANAVANGNCDSPYSKIQSQSLSWISRLTSAAGTFIGICIDGWLLLSFARDELPSLGPLITFAASASLAAAISSMGSSALAPSSSNNSLNCLKPLPK